VWPAFCSRSVLGHQEGFEHHHHDRREKPLDLILLGHSRRRDASKVAFVPIVLASDKAWAISGDVVAATREPDRRRVSKEPHHAARNVRRPRHALFA
jgi:hypothetical protein